MNLLRDRYAGMRVGRTAWTSAYQPPAALGGLERGAANLEQLSDGCTYRMTLLIHQELL